LKGVDKFVSETKYSCGKFNPLIPFYRAALDPLCKYFVMKVLVSENGKPRREGIVAEYTSTNTLNHKPLIVSVLYLKVPDDLKGGHLDILSADPENMKPVYSVLPQMNKMARFRGDIYFEIPEDEGKLLEYETFIEDGIKMM